MRAREVVFRAAEYRADQGFDEVELTFRGRPESGWTVRREGAEHLELGPGYRLLETSACGVCSTDLARHFLPFPLPQVTGHEVVARDETGRRVVVEINASHAARGVDSECGFCRAGLERHCPERLVLGIHDLPGGFGRWILAPERAVLAVPDALPDDTAVLVEPFAAALNAVEVVAPRPLDRVAVLGPRRLGLLVVAALAGHRRASRTPFEILALSRHGHLLEQADALGADRGLLVEGAGEGLPDGLADVVIDTTGNPAALELALRLAQRELHLKSTHGRPAGGLARPTELVVDELVLAPLPALPHGGEPAGRVARMDAAPPAELLRRARDEAPAGALPRFDAAIAASAAEVDRAVRPVDGDETSLVRPRGTIHLRSSRPDAEHGRSAVVDHVADRGLRITSSRCGDFRRALTLLAGDPALRDLGTRFVTHRIPARDLRRAFEVARSPSCVKAVVVHGA